MGSPLNFEVLVAVTVNTAGVITWMEPPMLLLCWNQCAPLYTAVMLCTPAPKVVRTILAWPDELRGIPNATAVPLSTKVTVPLVTGNPLEVKTVADRVAGCP